MPTRPQRRAHTYNAPRPLSPPRVAPLRRAASLLLLNKCKSHTAPNIPGTDRQQAIRHCSDIKRSGSFPVTRGERAEDIVVVLAHLLQLLVVWSRRQCEVSDGEAAVLRQGGREEGAVDGGGGPEARRLPPHPRPLLLARRSQARRAAEVRQELQAAVDQLPEARPQEGPSLRRRGEARHRPARPARQQVVQDRGAAPREDGQRDQEPLEHPHPEEAPQDGHRPRHPPAIAAGPCSTCAKAGARAASRTRATAERRRAAAGGGGGAGPAARDPRGERLRLRFLCLRRLHVGGLAVLLVLSLCLGGVRRGGDAVAGAHVPVRHGRHHGRRMGRPLPRRRRRRLEPRSVRPVPGRRLRSRRRLDVTWS